MVPWPSWLCFPIFPWRAIGQDNRVSQTRPESSGQGQASSDPKRKEKRKKKKSNSPGLPTASGTDTRSAMVCEACMHHPACHALPPHTQPHNHSQENTTKKAV
ncbi:hypothetical protein B0T24DRAFT_633936 [Lasiosphaeria ovina]|uniref:Uncharacterized protein n=1 Tax=Lasiosphaeria ovina TaxID=92902 RepID=A0AAE0JYT3_9PEZI|nr:hypothetical protein B0T24DRAFT_633936 [Lasiosphaeria ovina]